MWTADFVNDPNNDYELIIEVLYNGEDVGVIKPGKKGLQFILFKHNKDLVLPVDWLFGLISEAKSELDFK